MAGVYNSGHQPREVGDSLVVSGSQRLKVATSNMCTNTSPMSTPCGARLSPQHRSSDNTAPRYTDDVALGTQRPIHERVLILSVESSPLFKVYPYHIDLSRKTDSPPLQRYRLCRSRTSKHKYACLGVASRGTVLVLAANAGTLAQEFPLKMHRCLASRHTSMRYFGAAHNSYTVVTA